MDCNTDRIRTILTRKRCCSSDTLRRIIQLGPTQQEGRGAQQSYAPSLLSERPSETHFNDYQYLVRTKADIIKVCKTGSRGNPTLKTSCEAEHSKHPNILLTITIPASKRDFSSEPLRRIIHLGPPQQGGGGGGSIEPHPLSDIQEVHNRMSRLSLS